MSRAFGEAQGLLQRDQCREGTELFTEKETFDLGPTGGKGLRMERKEIVHGRSGGRKGREGRKCK